MDGVAQVVQQLANELSLIVLLDPVQNGRVGRRRSGGRDACLQTPSPSMALGAGTNVRAREFPLSLKKLPPRRRAGIQPPRSVKSNAGSRQYMLYCVAVNACLCSAGSLPALRSRIRALTD